MVKLFVFNCHCVHEFDNVITMVMLSFVNGFHHGNVICFYLLSL